MRQRGLNHPDIAAIFANRYGNAGYIARLTQGEFTLMGYRERVVDPQNIMATKQGIIKKRGRKTIINILKNYRWVTNHRQRTALLYGIQRNPSDD